ncbi:MAG: YbhB/YbcL family Raf kinase inhibitor-like protein [Chthoniobacterales bacterium]
MKGRLVLKAWLIAMAAATSAAAEPALDVTSPAFKSGGNIPAQFSCNGANVNPPLSVAKVPANAICLAVALVDPDAPGGTFTHWLVWNVDPKTSEIAANSVPDTAVQGTNDFGNTGYGGPCPPSGTHRYYFRVFALDAKLPLKPGAKAAQFEKAIAGHVIARGELMGRFAH